MGGRHDGLTAAADPVQWCRRVRDDRTRGLVQCASGAEYQHPSSDSADTEQRATDREEELNSPAAGQRSEADTAAGAGKNKSFTMTTKIIITPANHGAAKRAGAPLAGTARTVRVVTVGAPPTAGRLMQSKTLMTVPLSSPSAMRPQPAGRLASGMTVQSAVAAANRGQVRTVFKRVYSSTSESTASLPVMAAAPRKRQRLDHLSSDQKNQRRKLKNRVAAQTARDRKKMQMDLLEGRVTSLERRNDELLQQNTFLQKQNELLSQQNALLLQRLEPAAAPSAAAVTAAPASVESAALISGPQQQGQESGAADRRRPAAAAALLALSLVSWAGFQVALAATAVNMSIYSTSSARPYSAVKSRRPEGRRPPSLLWWGPQQKSWSPAMIR